MFNILSCFDGMSCGQIALNKAGIKYDKYYASEASKDVFGVESYKAATPRMTMLTYTYKF
jgi:hypothetical protein